MIRVLLLIVCLLLAGCGGGGSSTQGVSPSLGQPIAAPQVVPELADGVLSVGTDVVFPPIEFFPTGSQTPTGLDIDLANALASTLGVRAEFVNENFGLLIPDLLAGHFDIIMSAMSITPERSQQIDLVPYFSAGTGILQRTGAVPVARLEDLCGRRVAVQSGTVQVTLLQGVACGVQVVPFDVASDALAALEAGNVDAYAEDFPSAQYDASQSAGQVGVSPTQFDPLPYGIGVRKTSTALENALATALATIQGNGTYSAILKKWGLEAGAI
jgi:polar amino acid transport system substrate-binding protein